MKIVKMKCPNCGANLDINKDDTKVKCNYCNQNLLIDDSANEVKLIITGMINVDGIQSNADLINSGNSLIEIGEYLQAKKYFKEFSEKCPTDYQGWLGLLICRTRNFTIKDNNILFQKDVENYYNHFKKTANEEIFDEYFAKIYSYFNS